MMKVSQRSMAQPPCFFLAIRTNECMSLCRIAEIAFASDEDGTSLYRLNSILMGDENEIMPYC